MHITSQVTNSALDNTRSIYMVNNQLNENKRQNSGSGSCHASGFKMRFSAARAT